MDQTEAVAVLAAVAITSAGRDLAFTAIIRLDDVSTAVDSDLVSATRQPCDLLYSILEVPWSKYALTLSSHCHKR